MSKPTIEEEEPRFEDLIAILKRHNIDMAHAMAVEHIEAAYYRKARLEHEVARAQHREKILSEANQDLARRLSASEALLGAERTRREKAESRIDAALDLCGLYIRGGRGDV